MVQAYAFISYVRENSDIVDRLVSDLRAAGVKIWLDRDDIKPGQFWEDAIREAIQNGAFFIACYSKELNARPETYMHGELRIAIDRLRNIPRNRVWFIPVLLNDTEIPLHPISGHESLKDIHAHKLFENWNEGINKILQIMNLDDPDCRRLLHFIELLKYYPELRRQAIEHIAQLTHINTLTRMAVTDTEALYDEEMRRWAGYLNIGGYFIEYIPSSAHRSATVRLAVPALIEALRDSDVEVRQRAAIMLREIGPAAAEAVPALIEALRDPDEPA